MDTDTIFTSIRELMPDTLEDLKGLIRNPSVAFPGFPPGPVYRAADATVDLLRRYGLLNARLFEIPGGYPAVYGEIPAPPGTPTVMLYAHYDVLPAPMEQGWETDPWTPSVKDGRVYGRGAADNKNGILTHAATIRAFSGKPPVGVKVLIEGEEETSSHLGEFVEENPEFFACDAFLIADMGNLSPGEPSLVKTLRDESSCIITVSTLDHAVHSGQFGGAAPDAMTALVKILSALHDAEGNVAVPGLTAYPWEESNFPEDLYRRISGLLDGVALIGSGTISSRLWSGPSVTVTGIDVPSVHEASNILISTVSAKISLRTAPGADAERELEVLMEFLRNTAPWGVRVHVEKVKASSGFICPTGGRAYTAAGRAVEAAFGAPAREIGGGGSIPLLHTLQQAVPDAEFILWGSEDLAGSQIHGPNESVSIDDLERMIRAQCLLLQMLGDEKV